MLYMALVLMGWINIYAAGYDELLSNNIFDFSVALTNAQRQMLFMAASIILIVGIIVVDMRFFEAVAYLLYGFLRPWLSREWQREIEEEIGDEPEGGEAAEEAS